MFLTNKIIQCSHEGTRFIITLHFSTHKKYGEFLVNDKYQAKLFFSMNLCPKLCRDNFLI